MGNEIHRHADVRENVIEHSHHHDPNDVTDYMEAVKAYRATFPTKQDVIEKTPDPAVREMLLRMEQLALTIPSTVLISSSPSAISDWRNLRTGLAFVFGSVVNTNLATDSLFGVGERRKCMVNIGALKKGYVNIAVHGHMPTLVSEIVRLGHSREMIDLAKEKGAKGIQFYGICCTGLSAMYRYDHVIPLCNPAGSRAGAGNGSPGSVDRGCTGYLSGHHGCGQMLQDHGGHHGGFH